MTSILYLKSKKKSFYTLDDLEGKWKLEKTQGEKLLILQCERNNIRAVSHVITLPPKFESYKDEVPSTVSPLSTGSDQQTFCDMLEVIICVFR